MKRYVATIGFFDGVHIGHQKLISLVCFLAKQNDLKSLLITFDTVAKIKNNLIYSFKEKIKILKSLNIDKIKILKFNKIKNLPSEKFFKNFIFKNKVSLLVVGEDFKFGKNALANVNNLQKMAKKHGIVLFVITDVFKEIGKKIYSVSSSLIRENIIKCNFKEVEVLLGREYWISGKVVKGKGIGKKIGLPTINFVPQKDVLVPKGIFCGFAKIGSMNYVAVANFGYNPTINDLDKKLSCEVHIIDKNIDIVKKEISFRPLMKIRDERKFPSIESMKRQIFRDIEYVKKFFYKNSSFIL